MHFSDIIGNLGTNHIWRYLWILLRQKLHSQTLATLLNFFLLVCKLWKCESAKIHKNCLYCKVFCTDIYTKMFSTVCCFFRYVCWWVNCISWVSKLKMFLWHAQKLRQDLYLRAYYCPLWIVHFQLSDTFFAFFIWSVNCSSDFFSHFFSQ